MTRLLTTLVLSVLAVATGHALITFPAAYDAPFLVRVLCMVPGGFLIAWGITGRFIRDRLP